VIVVTNKLMGGGGVAVRYVSKKNYAVMLKDLEVPEEHEDKDTTEIQWLSSKRGETHTLKHRTISQKTRNLKII
jgi:hypothetical protein